MKKYFLLIISIFSLFSLISCGSGEDETKEPTIKEEPSLPSIVDDKTIPEYPHLKPEKNIYKVNEDIVVNLYNASDCNRVILTPYGREPISRYSISSKRIQGASDVTLNGSKITEPGDYTIWLTGENQYDYIYTYDIHIDNDDETDYGINSAEIKYDISFGIDYPNLPDSHTNFLTSIVINTNNTKELTYRFYWCKDGQRLPNYMAIKSFVSKDLNEITVDLANNLFKPIEANQIEVAVVEGVSTSYYIDVTDQLSLSESKYEFTFNAISDLHIQSLRDSIVFNGHLKTMLRNIYNTNSKGIVAVGDIVNFGKEEEYVFFDSLYKEVENVNKIGFYPAIGNHEYMYFDTFEEPAGYFKEHFELDSHYYSFTLNGYKFIILGTDTNSSYGVMNQIQLNWLKHELQSVEATQPVFVMMHQALKDTVDGTLYTEFGQTDYGFNQSETALKLIFSQYPNAFVFSGHSHHTLETNKNVVRENRSATYINCGSIAYLNQYTGSDCETEIGGSEGLFIEVYEDYILIRGKEFSYNRWVANCQIVLPRIK